MLMHCDFIYAGASTKFQMPFTTLLSFGGFAFSRWDEVAETWKKVPSIRQSLSLSSHSAAHASSQLWMKGGRMPHGRVLEL
jgi:hypothetical protein